MQTPVETRYARSGEVHIAYQTVGSGSVDLILLPGAFSHVEHQWEEPSFARFLRRLASFSRLIVLDVRGTGLSDRAAELPTLEEQINDVLAVLDAVGSERAALFGLSQGGGLAALFAAAHPDRTAALVLFGAYARILRADDYPWGRTPEEYETLMRVADEGWGSGVFLPLVAPTVSDDESFKLWWARLERLSGSPGAILAFLRTTSERGVGPSSVWPLRRLTLRGFVCCQTGRQRRHRRCGALAHHSPPISPNVALWAPGLRTRIVTSGAPRALARNVGGGARYYPWYARRARRARAPRKSPAQTHAGGETRTHTPLRAEDFKSPASTLPPPRRQIQLTSRPAVTPTAGTSQGRRRSGRGSRPGSGRRRPRRRSCTLRRESRP
jgi:pimeloyl-ACP methyl ester carboxylesterase